MKNLWLANKIVPKGEAFYTFEIYDAKKESIVPETCVELDEKPTLSIVEQLQNEDGVWEPVCMFWEKIGVTYTDRSFLESKAGIRMIEADGNHAAILRQYDKHGEHVESWVVHGLKMMELRGNLEKQYVAFTFHHAHYIYEPTDVNI